MNGIIVCHHQRSLTISKVMTILITFHESYCLNFKAYDREQVLHFWQTEFPNLASHNLYDKFIG